MKAILPVTAVEPFVRDCLGCGCPPSVFELVESFQKQHANVSYQRLLAGNRLLVYLLEVISVERLIEQVLELLHQGIEERDGAGYNRLRIVVVGTLDDVTMKRLTVRFDKAAPGDEKAHLHVVSEAEIQRYVQA